MKQILSFTLLLLSALPTVAQRTITYDPIPKPQIVSYIRSDAFTLRNGTAIRNRSKDEQMEYNATYLHDYLKRYCNIDCPISTKGEIYLIVKKAKGQSDEAYSIIVNKKGVTIEGNSPIGVFYGIQTLCQSIGTGEGSIFLPAVAITDSPRFSYRGFMLDFSRHFFGKGFVLRQIEAMSHYKLNRLHMHLTDAGGWRIEIKSHPELTHGTAYRTRADWRQWWDRSNDRRYVDEGTDGAYGGYFSQDDIREIVQFASKHGITVIPEIEMPGHCQDVFFVHPELCCTGNFLKQGDVCIGNDAIFPFFEDVLKEVAVLFPSEYIHIGGDECSMHTWPDCPKCQKRMNDEGLTKVADLQSWFVNKIDRFINGLGKKIIGWDEILEGKLSEGAAVMSWRGENGGIKAANQGHHVVMSPGLPLYLDQYQDSPAFCPDAQGRYNTLAKVYDYDPAGNVPTGVASYIDGLQGNLWTERVPTAEHAEYMMWPRLMAIAERGWSSKDCNDYGDFHNRALREVGRMQQDGYNPFDLKYEIGDRREFTEPIKHLALGKKVTYNLPYNNVKYKTSADALTDGLRGNWLYNDGRWQAFIDEGRMDVTIDLEKVVPIHAVYADFLQLPSPVVYYPNRVEIQISNDGSNFETIKTLKYEVNPDELYGIKEFGWHGNTEARYIRFKANCSSFGGWQFTDEIVVE